MVLACFFADDVVFMLAEIMVCDVFFFLLEHSRYIKIQGF